jgi:hypothetical protein
MKTSIASLLVIFVITIKVQSMPINDTPDTILKKQPVQAQHQLPNLEGKNHNLYRYKIFIDIIF